MMESVQKMTCGNCPYYWTDCCYALRSGEVSSNSKMCQKFIDECEEELDAEYQYYCGEK